MHETTEESLLIFCYQVSDIFFLVQGGRKRMSTKEERICEVFGK